MSQSASPLGAEVGGPLPPFRRIRRSSSLAAAALLGGTAAVAAMGARPALPGGFGLGLAGCVTAFAALLALLPRPRQGEGQVHVVPWASLRGPLLQAVIALLLFVVSLRIAVRGTLGESVPRAHMGLPITATFSWLLVSVSRGVHCLDTSEAERPASPWRRHGLWLAALTGVQAVHAPRHRNEEPRERRRYR